MPLFIISLNDSKVRKRNDSVKSLGKVRGTEVLWLGRKLMGTNTFFYEDLGEQICEIGARIWRGCDCDNGCARTSCVCRLQFVYTMPWGSSIIATKIIWIQSFLQ